MNQKEQDIKRILKYIESEDLDVVTVAQIAQHSGADYLRVSTILYELYLNGFFEVQQYSAWGVPESYIVKKTH